jgi:Carboxypeptidase regulatory-like domain
MRIRVSGCAATALCAFLVIAGSPRLSAQSVRGIVVDRADVPVPGVVIQLLDSASNVAARALTDAQGEFRVVARSAGTYRLHTLRIGFRPTDSSPIVLRPGPDITRRIVLTGLPVGLDTVRVAGRNACRALPDSGAAFAVWEQVRGAVTAAELTAAAQNVFTTVVSFERTLEADARRVRTQTSAIRSGYVREPWSSLSPAALHNGGYVVTDRDNTTTYYAPGLEVLLSPAFVEDHCFHLTMDGGRLGLAFEPTPDRRGKPEIRGTLWLDARSAELRNMEFRYSNVLPEQDAVARGEAGFVRMADGAWVISRWSIRMPLLEQVVRSQSQGGNQLQVAAVHVAGGELTLARRGNDTLWIRPLVDLAGTVLDSISGKAIAGARVKLGGTQIADSTDARGRFSLRGVLLGEYTMEVRTPSLDSMNAVHQIPIAFADSSAPVMLRVPNAAQLLSLVCGGTRLEWPGIVLGTVTSVGDSAPPRNAKVVAKWTQRFMPLGGQDVTNVSVREQAAETRTDANGRFRLCGVPVDNPISLRAGNAVATTPVVVRIPPKGRFARAELVVDPRALDDFATFAGTVVDSAGRPIAMADVSVPDLAKSTATDGAGAFRIEGLPPGSQRVLIRRVGYRAIDTSLAFAVDRPVQRRFELARAVTLDSVIVTEAAVDKRMESFDENRRLGLGRFVTRAELAKLEGGASTSSILQSFNGLSMVRGKGGRSWITAAHGSSLVKPNAMDSLSGAHPSCYAQVYLDRTPVYQARDDEPLFDVNSIPPSRIEAIEYYPTPAQIPAQYNRLNSSCGVLVIWTRRSP